MNEQTTPVTAENSAWAEFKTPLEFNQLKTFCSDVERLFRINPYLDFKQWQKTAANQFHVSGHNTSQGEPFEFEFDITVEDIGQGVRVTYNNSLKLTTTFKVEAAEQGSKLTIIDEYANISADEATARSNEVDKSLVAWANYLQRFILTWKKWSWLAPWRWYMRRIWQPMKPMSRRITYMLIWITVFEVALIALGVAIYFAEYAR